MTWIFFERMRSLYFCIGFVGLSAIVEFKFGWIGIFSASGSVVSLAGLFLNIKHSLNFHLNIPINSIYNKLAGAGIFGSQVTPEGEKWVQGVLSDEVYGVAFRNVSTTLRQKAA